MSMQRVAQLAGVSTSTVSRVFSDRPRVAEATVAAVRRAVREIGFTPSRKRRSSIGAKNGSPASGAITFLVLGTSGSNAAPAFEMLLRGVSDAANVHDLTLNLSFVSDPAQLPSRLLERSPAGVLCHGDQPSAGALERLRTLPTVWLMANRHRPRWGDQVMPNNAVIGDLAGRYLVRRGHRRVAYLGASPDAWAMRLRAFAFGKAADDAGADVRILSAPAGASVDYWSASGLAAAGERLVEQMLARTPLPTGLFIEEDRLLPVVDRALRSRGLDPCPGGEIELVSCNNEQPHYAHLPNAPARIDIRSEAIGRRGVEQLAWRMRHAADAPERVRIMVEPALIEPAPIEPVTDHVQQLRSDAAARCTRRAAEFVTSFGGNDTRRPLLAGGSDHD